MKKWNKWLTATVVVSTVVTPVGATTTTNQATTPVANNSAGTSFADGNTADSWAQGAIAKAKDLGLMTGDPSGNFRPKATITRQELAVILTKALKLDVPSVSTSAFTDVNGSTWGRNYVEAVRKAGIMSGDGSGHFRPNDPISREELAVVLVKAANVSVAGKGQQLAVADKSAVSSWAKDYVAAAIELGLMKGDGVHFNPQGHATRQEIAVVAVNFVTTIAPTAQASAIESVGDGTVTIQGVSYQVSDHVTGILNAKNADVLKGAKVTFESDNGTLTKITYLEITASGQAAATGEKEFSEDLVLDGNNGTIDGNLKVAGDYISLQNLTVTGDLEIGTALQNDFYSNNLKVEGKTVVNGGASNTVVFDNASLGTMEVNKPNVRVEPTGTTTVGEVTLTTNATITADSGVTIPKVTVQDGVDHVQINATVSNLNLQGQNAITIDGNGSLGNVTVAGSGHVQMNTTGSVSSIQVSDPNATLSIQPGTKVGNLVLPNGSKPSDIIQNYDQIKGQISNVNGSTNSDAPVISGGGGSGGGTGGGGSVLTAPTLSSDITYNDTLTPLDITFSDNSTWRGAITAVKDGPNTLTAGKDYQVTTGKITIKAGVLNQGTHMITISATGYPNATVNQVVLTAPTLLLNPTLTVYAPNVDQGWEGYVPNTVYQVNVNFATGTTSGDFTSAEVSLYNGTTLLATNTAKPELLNQNAPGLTDLFGMGDKADSTSDSNWDIGDYSALQAPDRVVFKLTDKQGAVHTVEGSLTAVAKPAAPNVTADDDLNKIIGLNTDMEYQVDNGVWTKYDGTSEPDLSGTLTVLVRLAATGSTPAGETTSLYYTETFTGDVAKQFVQAQDFAYAANSWTDSEGNLQDGYNVGFKLNLTKFPDYQGIKQIKVSLLDSVDNVIATKTADTAARIAQLKSDDNADGLDGQVSALFVDTDIYGKTWDEWYVYSPYHLEKPAKAQIEVTDDSGNVYIVDNANLLN